MSVEIRKRCKVTSIVDKDVTLTADDGHGETIPGDLAVTTVVVTATPAAAQVSFWDTVSKYQVIIRRMS